MPIVATESDIALRDGSTVHVRPVGPEDVERIECFLGELSDEARSFRFFTGAADLGQMALLFTETRGARAFSPLPRMTGTWWDTASTSRTEPVARRSRSPWQITGRAVA